MATKPKKKSTLSPEGRKKIIEAQRRRHAAAKSAPLPAPIIPKVAEPIANECERPEDATRRYALRVSALEEELGDANDERDDLIQTITNELRYHELRVIELNRELERRGITIG